MAKSYRLSKLETESQAEELEERILKIKGVHYAKVIVQNQELEIAADTGRFSSIMDQIVNICRQCVPNGTLVYAGWQ